MSTKTAVDDIQKKFQNFRLKRQKELPEIHCTLLELEHIPTGAQVMHLQNDDPENVFCLSFQTVPQDSTGVAHILEHTVLCGSEKFPVKDPFFAMTRRSLNTFMNAFTGADFTCYPAASQVPKDFYNLLEVYLDAVFKPNLRELSFMQEGHHLEVADPTSPDSPLLFKGVVFNEMKGAMTTPDSRLGEALDAALFPNVTYGFNSGGDPKDIPQLTYQQLRDFHATYYHPSRCLFFFYGNLPLERHLDFLEQQVLNNTEKRDPLSRIPAQPRFTAPKRTAIGFPFSDEEDPRGQTMISFGWLTCSILEQEEALALSILSVVLLGTDAAPLKKAILKSGLCKQVSASLGDEYNEIPLVITLRGCEPENGDDLEKVISDALEKICSTGIPEELVESAIHQLEFHRSEITGDGYPYGLSLFLRSGLLKQHGGNPEDALRVHTLFNTLRARLRDDPAYFLGLIRTYFLDNQHFVRVIAKPDKTLAAKELEEEKAALDKIAAALNAGERSEIANRGKELQRFQEEQEHADLNVLPKVTLKDVSRESRNYPLAVEEAGSLKVFHHNCFTNGIVYPALVFPLPALDEKELPLLKLFSLLMPQVGCGGRSYEENLDYIQAHTGGVDADMSANPQVDDYNVMCPYFLVEGKALHRKADKLFTLLHQMVTSTDFTDVNRLKEVVLKHFTGLQASFTQRAMKYAMGLATCALNPASRMGNACGGMEYFHFIKDLAENFDKRAKDLVAQLTGMQERILCLREPHLVITCDEEMYNQLKREKFYGLKKLPEKAYKPWKTAFSPMPATSQGRIIASPVAFTASAFPTVSYTHPDAPALSVAAHLFDNLTLHPRIREQGGAYGGGAANHPSSGSFCFYGYRDPNLASTLAAFEEAIQKVLDGDFKDSELEEAKLEIYQGLDSPIAPGSRGLAAYTWLREGKTLAVRQQLRDTLYRLGREAVIRAVAAHISPKYSESCTVSFAGKDLLEKENALLAAQGKKTLPIFQDE